MNLGGRLPTTALLSLSGLALLLLNSHGIHANESKPIVLDRSFSLQKASHINRRLQGWQTGTNGENSRVDDYEDENLWVGQSDFEGLFEEEGVIGYHNYITSDYEDSANTYSNEVTRDALESSYYEDFRKEGIHEGVSSQKARDFSNTNSAIHHSTFGQKNSAPGVFVDGKIEPNTLSDDSSIDPRGFDLPSFEETPMPKKMSFPEWRKKNLQGILKQGHTEELTSSLFLVPEAKPLKGKNYVASCLVVRDDHDGIIEWINHHLSLGIRPIYVYDHLSLPPLDSFLKSFIVDGTVLYERLTLPVSTDVSPQLYAYDKCLSDHGHKHMWLAFLDVDEFIIFRDGHPIQNLPAFLVEYESFSSLALHWILFGSSEHETRPTKSVLRSYMKCLPLKHAQHLFVKSIVNTKCTVGTADSPHSFKHNCSAPAVRTDLSPINGATANGLPVHDKLVIHHYATKSVEDFEMKVLKGSGMRRQRGWEYFFFVDGWSTEFNFDGIKVWNSDLLSKTRALDPETLNLQIEGYSKEVLEDFWGNSQTTKEDVLDYFENDQDYTFAIEQNRESIDDDADEGEW